jgi:oligopeptide/dipeptide ABC transporter ATP-binding protein
MGGTAILQIKNLKKRFNAEAGFFARFGSFVTAVNDVSFDLARGETYALVGESGCGKTTTARLVMGMYPADGGSILYDADSDGGTAAQKNICAMNKAELRAFRENAKYIFQDPARSLNPRLRVKDILLSGYRWSRKWPGKTAALEQAVKTLEEVGLVAEDMERRPQDFSGGQRQRIAIARALLLRPELFVCDEVVSALDVSIQGQILNLLLDLRRARSLSMIFITHDLKIACFFCDRVGVMYRGELMEEAPAKDLDKHLAHPYTKLLFDSVRIDGKPAEDGAAHGGGVSTHSAGTGEVSRAENAGGCAFAHRCPQADDRCGREKPQKQTVREGHTARCFKIQGAETVR